MKFEKDRSVEKCGTFQGGQQSQLDDKSRLSLRLYYTVGKGPQPAKSPDLTFPDYFGTVASNFHCDSLVLYVETSRMYCGANSFLICLQLVLKCCYFKNCDLHRYYFDLDGFQNVPFIVIRRSC